MARAEGLRRDGNTRRAELRRRVAEFMLDETFREGVARDPDGNYRWMVADWSDSVGDVFTRIDDLSQPLSVFLPVREGSILVLHIELPNGDQIGAPVKTFFLDDPIRDLAIHIMSSETPYAAIVIKPRRALPDGPEQLVLEFGPPVVTRPRIAA